MIQQAANRVLADQSGSDLSGGEADSAVSHARTCRSAGRARR